MGSIPSILRRLLLTSLALVLVARVFVAGAHGACDDVVTSAPGDHCERHLESPSPEEPDHSHALESCVLCQLAKDSASPWTEDALPGASRPVPVVARLLRDQVSRGSAREVRVRGPRAPPIG